MSMLLLLKKGNKASHLINFDSEDVISSIIWTHLRLLDPNLGIRPIVNNALGWNAIEEDKFTFSNLRYEFWKRIPPPIERSKSRHKCGGASLFPGLENEPLAPREGHTEADVWLKRIVGDENTVTDIIMFEMKLHSGLSKRTSNDPRRNQMVRNLDVLTAYCARNSIQRFVLILWDAHEKPERIVTYLRDSRWIERLLPAERLNLWSAEEISARIGHTSYSKVREILETIKKAVDNQQQRKVLDDLIECIRKVNQSC
jgi:hypothetical protein